MKFQQQAENQSLTLKNTTDEAAPVPSVDNNAPLKIDSVEEKVENEPQDKSNKKLFILGGIFLGIIAVATVALFIFNLKQPTQEVTQEVKTKISLTPTVIPNQSLIRSEWSFEVLNGSGVVGADKKAADQLTTLGYQVVTTGNADKQTYKGNELFVSQEMESKADLLIADLKDTFKIATVAGILKSSTPSARLIIGKE